MNRDGIETGHSDELFAEQVKLLYNNAPLIYSTTLINGTILIYVQRTHIATFVLLAWYGCLLLATAARARAAWQYIHRHPASGEARRWNRIYFIIAVVEGIVWGSAAVALFPVDSISHQVFIAFILAGMAAGAVTVLAPRMEVCLAFLLPELLPLAIRYLSIDTSLHRAMGILTLIFIGGMFVSALNFHRSIIATFNLGLDKSALEEEIARRRRAEEELFREKERLQTTLSSIGESVVLINAAGLIEYLNPATEQLFGWSCHDVLNRRVNEVFKSVNLRNEATSTAMEDSLRLRNRIEKRNILFCKSEKRHFIEEIATPLYDSHGQLAGTVAVLRDVTEAQQRTDQLAYAADHDPLTGLPNRNLLKDRTRQAIARAQRKHENFALLFLDLDRFKAVNDSMGHAAGDALLVDVAKRLSDCVREEDTIARLGGDEFVVLLDGPTQERQVRAVADKIRITLREPYRLGARYASVTVSIGCSLYPIDGQDAETLLGHADTAMYRAKRQGIDWIWR